MSSWSTLGTSLQLFGSSYEAPGRPTIPCLRTRAQLRGDSCPRSRIPELAVPTPTRVAPAYRRSRACCAGPTPPMPTTGSLDPVRDRRHLGQRDGRTAGPQQAAGPPPSHCGAGGTGQGQRAQRVDQRDGVRALRLGGLGDRGDVGGVRRQLHDQRLGGPRADLPSTGAGDAGSAPMSSPVFASGTTR